MIARSSMQVDRSTIRNCCSESSAWVGVALGPCWMRWKWSRESILDLLTDGPSVYFTNRGGKCGVSMSVGVNIPLLVWVIWHTSRCLPDSPDSTRSFWGYRQDILKITAAIIRISSELPNVRDFISVGYPEDIRIDAGKGAYICVYSHIGIICVYARAGARVCVYLGARARACIFAKKEHIL